MNKDTRESLLLPILMPIGILLAILVVAVGFSRILLSLTAAGATAVALLAALTIMVFASVAVTRTRLKGGAVLAMVAAVVGLTLFFGGAVLSVAGGPVEKGAGAEAVVVHITAKDVLFAETAITVPVGVPIVIEFDNQDAGVQHNVEVFDGPDAKAPVLMDGEVTTGSLKITYEVAPLDAGSYYFICKIHPTTMTGTITADPNATAVTYGEAQAPGTPSMSPSMVMGGSSPTAGPSEAPPTGGEEPAGKPVTLSITAPAGSVGTGFAEKTLKAPAGTPIKLVFDNQDTGVPHNVEIWTADPLKDSGATSLFVGDQTTGPAEITYDVPPLEPGTYFYRCVVHPTTMTGTLTVK
jgi:plastocyanin